MIQELKQKFEDKTFVTSVGEARFFCLCYGLPINFPSRVAAKSKIFRFITNKLGEDEIKIILDEERFSGPSRLRPIADAIRRNGRASKYHA